MKRIEQNPDRQHEYYAKKFREVELFEEDEEIMVEPGDIVISSEAAFDDILEVFSLHSELFMGEYMTPKEIWEEMGGYF